LVLIAAVLYASFLVTVLAVKGRIARMIAQAAMKIIDLYVKGANISPRAMTVPRSARVRTVPRKELRAEEANGRVETRMSSGRITAAALPAVLSLTTSMVSGA
jgi:hypothetical protein